MNKLQTNTKWKLNYNGGEQITITNSKQKYTGSINIVKMNKKISNVSKYSYSTLRKAVKNIDDSILIQSVLEIKQHKDNIFKLTIQFIDHSIAIVCIKIN